jgi:membrane-associated protein
MLSFLDPQNLIPLVGLVGIFAIVFAESGLFFGFFFPGDSLLFTAGLLAATGHLSIIPLCIGSVIAAIAGDAVGYAFGAKVGPKLFTREDSVFFHKKHLERAGSFYAKYGIKTIILARFVPIVRTFAPIVAGAGGMKYKAFFTYNIIGGTLWALGMTLLGYILGATIPGVTAYLHYIIAGIILISLLPIVREWYNSRR